MSHREIYIESLGCVRNNVDSEVMAGQLELAGHKIVDDPYLASVVIVNTCGFISAASEEAVDIILSMAQLKKIGQLKRLIVTGCLVERYKNDNLLSSMPEVDAFLGTAAVSQIVNAVEDKSKEILTFFPDPDKQKQVNEFSPLPRKFTSITPAYIKVSEGCKRKCTYCIIPKLRGPQRSRPVNDILFEVEKFVAKGSKEIILVAESTTDYGQDLKEDISLENVLGEIVKNLRSSDRQITESPWIRLLYTYPSTLSKNIINIVINTPEICSYFDVPVQHASSRILKRMGRDYSKDDLYNLFRSIRTKNPEAALRTTIITGFPGETKEDFNDLLEFIELIKFDHLGVFTYSDSDDLKSHNFDNHVPDDIAMKRHDIIMEKQAQISYNINLKHIGKTYQALVEEKSDTGVYLGRTRFQAPEVDGLTFIYGFNLEIGTLVDVKITEAFEYDIAGEVV
ncbi:MAG: 30S ribosomal protein S12 methylthiotransferase RimO [Desulfobacterales bacterium]|nr:30S ribosomal protein S12 methylthiotransferase RimO [Desulfobacterales bacterium]